MNACVLPPLFLLRDRVRAYVWAFPPQDLPGGGIKDETSVEVEDFSQDLTVKLNIFHKTFDEEEVRAPLSNCRPAAPLASWR